MILVEVSAADRESEESTMATEATSNRLIESSSSPRTRSPIAARRIAPRGLTTDLLAVRFLQRWDESLSRATGRPKYTAPINPLAISPESRRPNSGWERDRLNVLYESDSIPIKG